MTTVASAIARFKRHYPGCSSATATELFNTAYKRILGLAEFRVTDVTFGSIVAGQREYDWAETDLRCYGVTYFKTQTSWRTLLMTSEANLSDTDPDWKDETQLQAAISVSAASAATPTVLTVPSGHGLLAANDGTLTNQVFIYGVDGVTDDYYFAKVTGYSTTTFGLYSDISLTTGVAGSGTVQSNATMQTVGPQVGTPNAFYIAGRADSSVNKTGKLVLGFDVVPDTTTSNGYPYAVAHCEGHAAISGMTQLPYTLLDEMYIVYAMCELYSAEEDIGRNADWKNKRIAEESVQVEHLRGMIPLVQTVLLPPFGGFSTPMSGRCRGRRYYTSSSDD